MLIVLWILMFMGLVLAHEIGHFITAKRSGIKVLEFGICIPPKVCTLRTDKSGTKYTLNLIPLGGFVRLKGEDPDVHEDFHAKDSFIKAKIRRKVIIMIAGVGMNLIVARALFTAIFTMGTQPISVLPENALISEQNSYLMPTKTFLYEEWFISEEVKKQIEKNPVTVSEVDSGSLSSTLGILSGDIITSINNINVNEWGLSSVLKENIGWDISISYTRNWKSKTVQWVCPKDDCILWIAFAVSYEGELSGINIKFPFFKAMRIGAKEIKAQTTLTFSALGTVGSDLLSLNKKRIKTSLNKLTGPVGAIKFGEKLFEAWWRKLYLGFAGMISLALAIFNILPIPALDGGRLLGVLIQWIAKLKPEKYFNIEWYINLVFFVALMALWIYILLKDLVRFREIKIPFFG